MTFRGSMPPGQPFHGQPSPQQQQQHYIQYPAQQQQPQQQGQQVQHHDAQRFGADGGGGGYQQSFYDAGGQAPQYLPQQQRQAQPMQSTGYVNQGMNQFPGYDAMGYNPYMQQPAAAQYMPPPNVWQQQQQQQQQLQAEQQRQLQHQQQMQQQQQINQQRMGAMRASPAQHFDQLPQQPPMQHHQQPPAHQMLQHHPQHYAPPQQQQPQPQPPPQQHHAHFPAHHQPSPSPSPSPRFPSQMIPQHQAASSPSAQHMPHPQHGAQPQYRPSPTQPSPKTVPVPRTKKTTPAAPSPRATSQHATPPAQRPTQIPASSAPLQQQQQQQQPPPRPRQTPVPPPQIPQAAAAPPPPPTVQSLPRPEPQTQSQPQPQPEPEREPVPAFQPEHQAEPPEQSAFENFQFVNLQDIQQMPLLPPLPFENLSSVSKATPARTEEVAPARTENVAPIEPMAVDAVPTTESKEPPLVKPKQEPADSVQIKASPRSSVAPSPALSQRSLGSISKKSPSMSNKQRPGYSASVLVAVADEMLGKARTAVHDVAMSLSPERVEEYEKLISISAGCLEAALHTGRLTPRQEARLRLRYATLLHEETENVMECETTLSKGITLCDNHRLHDLKYSSQYLLLRVLFHRNRKAALKAIDNHISDCETFKHVNWYYAFRLLKATLCMEAGTASDASSLDNLRALQTAASNRGDNALCVFASLLEGLTFLKASRDGAAEKVQACLAQAAKHQLDHSVNIPQIEILTLLLDVATSIHTNSPEVTGDKLRNLQKRFDECTQWGDVKSEFVIPIRKSSTSGKTVSGDTATVLRSDERDERSDYLVLSFMTKVELTSLIHTIGGLANFLRPDRDGQKTTGLWQEGLQILEQWDQTTSGIPYGAPVSLPVAIRQRQWRNDAQCYINTLLGVTAASRCRWDAVQIHLTKLEQLLTAEQNTLGLFVLYLKGVYLQGTGDLRNALVVFQDASFRLPESSSSTQSPRSELALLAAMNRLWIMQHPAYQNHEETTQLIEDLRPLCANHTHINLRSTWQTVLAALCTEPPQPLSHRKANVHAALQGSKTVSNVFLSAIGLCIMRHYFFEDIVGDQALKSARAAAKTAQRSGNVLWESVADGMLAHSYETGGFREEAAIEHQKGAQKAAAAFARSS